MLKTSRFHKAVRICLSFTDCVDKIILEHVFYVFLPAEKEEIHERQNF